MPGENLPPAPNATDRHERRAPGVNRVAVARVVDICGRDATVPAFEAESIELSGRGMHVRTPYLPPLGAPLVCRLEDGGREIVVEGVVSWQHERKDGGEFGIQFTALDSGSVDALRGLCGLEAGGAAPANAAAAVAASPDPSSPPAPAGMPVKLHIDGLGAPMKARVRTGGSRRLQVGSNLEFLKVGRGLEVEDVEQGARRGARIDAVSIAIDPHTQVPQLVVALRYDGEDTTPEPSVIGGDDAAEAGRAAARAVAAKATTTTGASTSTAASDAGASTSADAGDDRNLPDDDEGDDASPSDEDDDEDAAAAMRGRVDAFAVQIGNAAKNTGEKLASASGSAAKGFARWARAARAKAAEASARREGTKRRFTAPAPQAASPGGRKLRPQNGSPSASDEPTKSRKKLVLVATSATILSLAIGAFALTGHSSKHATDSGSSASQVLATSTPQGLPSMPALNGSVPNAMTPSLNGAPATGAATNATPGQRSGIIANVPLFGPTPMATMEPAPLGPSPDELAAAKGDATPRTAEERMDESDLDSAKGAHDESFSEGKDKKDKSDDKDKSDKDRAAEEKAAEVKPWGLGKLHLPVVHRLKLDHPGAALEGKKDIAGFSVVIPGRKVESGASVIPKRDDRIADVRTKNAPDGAHVTFVFRSKIPGYKVRLRKNYLEVFVSSPDGAK